MLKCKDCAHKVNVPGTHHVSCNKATAVVDGVSDHGVKNGWFSFPLNYDPIWAEKCHGFLDNSKKIEDMDKDELAAVFRENFVLVAASMQTHFKQVSPFMASKFKQRLEAFQKAAERIGSRGSIEAYTEEELRELTPLIAAV